MVPSSSWFRRFSTLQKKNLIYVGPVNQMVKRMKTFSIGSSLVSTAVAPALIYFSADHWSLFAKFGLVSTGIPSTPTSNDFDHLLIEKLSFWGRRRVGSVPLADLINGASIFNTWKSVKTGEGFLIQYIPSEEQTGTGAVKVGNVTSYQGEKVDSDSMTRIYNEIASRR